MARTVSKGKPGKDQVAKPKGGASALAGVTRDARSRIITNRRLKMADAREKLVSLTRRSGDARKRLEKIRNLKMGKLDVKTTAKGRITITTTTQGKTLLTTKKKANASSSTVAKNRVIREKSPSEKRKGKNVMRTVGRGGTISLRTKGKVQPTLTGVAKSKPKHKASPSSPISRSAASGSAKKITRTIKGTMSEAAKLDMELMNTQVDPVILKRTISNDVNSGSRRLSPPPRSSYRHGRYTPDRYRMYRPRSRSPVSRGRYHYDYDDPRREMEREEGYGRQLQRVEVAAAPSVPTMADRMDALGGNYVSPLEGAKVIVSNLSDTVSRDDIVELFGDVGALKRAKMSTSGVAEVVFVNRSDAQKAVEIYHNRQLDGKAMRCQIVGVGGLEMSGGISTFKLPATTSTKDYRRGPDSKGVSGMPVELNSIHKALFSDRKHRGDGGRRPRY